MSLYHDSLQKVGCEVLENWAMMLVEPALPDLQLLKSGEFYYVVSVSYSGVIDGKLWLACQETFLDTLARNVLGLQSNEPVDKSERLDSLRELGNIVSGNFLTEAFGHETVFDLPSFDVCEKSAEELTTIFNSPLPACLGDGEPLLMQFAVEAK